MSLPLAFRATPPPVWVATKTGNQNIMGVPYFRQDVGADYSLLVANNLGNSFRSESGATDFVEGQTDRSRSELQSSIKLPFGVTHDAAFMNRSSDTMPALTLSDNVIWQYHQTEDAGDASGYPPAELNLGDGYTADGRRYKMLRVYTATNPTASDPAFYPRTLRASVPYELDVWHDIIIRIRFGWSGDAMMKVWLDGAPIVDVSGVSIGMNDAVGPYHKFGCYWHDLTAGRVITNENIHVVPPGIDADLSARVSNPPPRPSGDENVSIDMIASPLSGAPYAFITDPRPGHEGRYVTLP
ncbi:heparin lyase I family protein [Sphingobium yanoikuyae]|uniref:heparin lyase I family protein n=1 Tax=Sphingobium yanoikuyae TaxID=13690 RepID=UPI000847A243|nr:heparin lyase I family protein [Sphingobium yanoikuyae]